MLHVPRYLLLFPPRRYCWAVPFSYCRRLTPLAQAGMETPTGVCCLAKLATNLSPSTSPVCSLTLLQLYFTSRTLWLSPFASFLLWDSLAVPPFFGNGLAPRSSHVASPCIAAQADSSARAVAVVGEWQSGRSSMWLVTSETPRVMQTAKGTRTMPYRPEYPELSLFVNKPLSYLMSSVFHSDYYFTGKKHPRNPSTSTNSAY